jgi:hypothetical protein
MTRQAILQALIGDGRLTLPDGRHVILQSVEREDGSGRSFNLRVSDNGQPCVIYVRVKDSGWRPVVAYVQDSAAKAAPARPTTTPAESPPVELYRTILARLGHSAARWPEKRVLDEARRLNLGAFR